MEFADKDAYQRFVSSTKLTIDTLRPEQNQVKIRIMDADIQCFFQELRQYPLNFLSEIKFTLEDYFMDFYDRKKSVAEGKAGMTYGIH